MERDLTEIRSDDYKDEVVPDFEDRSTTYIQFLEAHGIADVDPLSPEGLASQAKYLKSLDNNCHPLDILRGIALNKFVGPRDRISACKAIMDYTMMKVPAKLEVNSTTEQMKIDPTQLAKLSNDEIELLLTLLEKASS